MAATVEILSGTIRVGPQHFKYGDPYEYAVMFSSVDGKTAVLKALTQNPEVKFGKAHFKDIVEAVRASGLEPTWERFK